MEIRYNVTGSERKRLADYIAGFLGCEKKYLGVPSYAYRVGYMEVSKDGTVSFDDRADSEEIEALLEELEQEGFHAEPSLPQDGEEQPFEEVSEAADTAPQETNVELTVEIPLDKIAVGNLNRLLDAKGGLIKKALGVDALPIEILEDRVAFPWFPEMPDADAVKVYTHFISALCEMSRNAKRVTVTEKKVDNEKYAFRCFLLRLGFIGTEYKTERKILLKNLTGSSAFKNGGVSHEVSE
ncbi:virulence protein [Anaeromassilibacillus sp. An172]|uniref:virulence protein n=1 Tax=Anaeromassilibacillus sp. An172 TaxID=1965570 RepID=UPI000B3873CB|nr:virulence protein [Anaeromassilibacillus sp. An172]OUP74216.1 virulence protein [Anaeromassilibacillus sp. An172]